MAAHASSSEPHPLISSGPARRDHRSGQSEHDETENTETLKRRSPRPEMEQTRGVGPWAEPVSLKCLTCWLGDFKRQWHAQLAKAIEHALLIKQIISYPLRRSNAQAAVPISITPSPPPDDNQQSLKTFPKGEDLSEPRDASQYASPMQ